MKILVLNPGSSSQKSPLYEISGSLPADSPVPAWQGQIEWDGDQGEIRVQNSKGANRKQRLKVESRRHAIEQLLGGLVSGVAPVGSGPAKSAVVGHPIVPGGQD